MKIIPKKIVKETIISMILGDGSLYKNKDGFYYLSINHGEKQIDYLKWKVDIINDLNIFNNNNIHKVIIELNGKKYNNFKAAWCKKDILKPIYNLISTNGKKDIKKMLRYINSYLSLAIWFMDDGSVLKRKKITSAGNICWLVPTCKLCTHCYSKSENEYILNFLKEKFDIDGYTVIERKKNRPGKPEYYTLNFNGENTKKIWDIIKPYVLQIDCMKEKFDYINSYYK